jgi:hypothetical protein
LAWSETLACMEAPCTGTGRPRDWPERHIASGCGNSARPDLCGGPGVGVPTANVAFRPRRNVEFPYANPTTTVRTLPAGSLVAHLCFQRASVLPQRRCAQIEGCGRPVPERPHGAKSNNRIYRAGWSPGLLPIVLLYYNSFIEVWEDLTELT